MIHINEWYLLIYISRQGSLSGNSLCRPGWPRTQKSACFRLPIAGIKGVRHYTRPANIFLIFFLIIIKENYCLDFPVFLFFYFLFFSFLLFLSFFLSFFFFCFFCFFFFFCFVLFCFVLFNRGFLILGLYPNPPLLRKEWNTRLVLTFFYWVFI